MFATNICAMRIFLLGFMGSGKSTIGRQLSKLMNLPFIDLDHCIEIQESTSISKLFEERGEVYFRELETRTLRKLISENENVILSLGGGTPCFHNNMIDINNSGLSVYLEASPEELSRRLINEKDHRPLLAGKSDQELLEFIKMKLQEREAFYKRSKLTFDSEKGTVEGLVDLICS